MKTNFIKLMLQVVAIDVGIVVAYWIIACGVDVLTKSIPEMLSMVLIFILWAVLFFTLFFSNSRLFTWFENSYFWSLSTGFLTLILVIPVIIISVHKPCFLIFW